MTDFLTKQNVICKGRSAWNGIVTSVDFGTFTPGVCPSASPPLPIYDVVRPYEDAKYVLVLDVSESMAGDRLDMVKQAAMRKVVCMLN
jgi:hypothetical protein